MKKIPIKLKVFVTVLDVGAAHITAHISDATYEAVVDNVFAPVMDTMDVIPAAIYVEGDLPYNGRLFRPLRHHDSINTDWQP